MGGGNGLSDDQTDVQKDPDMARQPASISASLETNRKNKQKPGGKAKKANCRLNDISTQRQDSINIKTHFSPLGTKTIIEKRSKSMVLVPSKYVNHHKGFEPRTISQIYTLQLI